MKNCPAKNKFIDYVYGELNEEESVKFQNHVDVCSTCSEYLVNLMHTNELLSKRIRPSPKKALLNSYYKNLHEIYRSENWIERLFKNIFEHVVVRPSFALRLAEIAVIFVLGIFIGKNTFKPDIAPQLATEEVVDIKFLNNYLFEAEMLLLEITNVEEDGDFQSILRDQNYAYLLQKTVLLKEEARRSNDTRLLNFLDEIELILLELTNLEAAHYFEELNMMRKRIKDLHLFVQLKALIA